MTFPEQVETERLLLRWPQEADAEEMFARYTHDPVVAHYMLWAPHKSADGTREWLRSIVADREAGRSFIWLIRRRSNNEVLGSIGGGVATLSNSSSTSFGDWSAGMPPQAVFDVLANCLV